MCSEPASLYTLKSRISHWLDTIDGDCDYLNYEHGALTHRRKRRKLGLTTPPGSNTMTDAPDPNNRPTSPNKRRRRNSGTSTSTSTSTRNNTGYDEQDDENGRRRCSTLRASQPSSLASVGPLSFRPQLQSRSSTLRSGSRAPSPTKSVIKSVDDMKALQKPVRVTSSIKTSQDLPEDVRALYIRLRNLGDRRARPFIPAEVRAELNSKSNYPDDLFPDAWFKPPTRERLEGIAEAAAAQQELQRLRKIVDRANDFFATKAYEDTWNSGVHWPLMELVEERGKQDREEREREGGKSGETERIKKGKSRDNIAIAKCEHVASVTLDKDCIPRIASGSSTSDVATVSSGGGGDDTDEVARRIGSKKVDFVWCLSAGEETSLGKAIKRTVGRLQQGPEGSINPTSYWRLRNAPIAVCVETKTITASRDPLVQLGIWVAAWHHKMERVHRLLRLSDTADKRLPTLPLIVIVDHSWEVHFACDRGRYIEVLGPIPLGHTYELHGAYLILENLTDICRWILDTFQQEIKGWVIDEEEKT